MSFGAVSPEVVSISPEEELLRGGSEFLLQAFRRVQRLAERVDDHAQASKINVGSLQYNERMSEAGNRLVRRLDYEGRPRAEVTAVGVLANAAHFYDVQSQLSNSEFEGSGKLRRGLTYEACHYNRQIKEYAKADPQAHIEDLLTAMMATHGLVDPSVGIKDSEHILRRRVKGMFQEHVLFEVVRAGAWTKPWREHIRETTVAEDMAGWDLIMRCSNEKGFPIDVAASEAAVYRKCGEYSNYGLKRSVLVLYSGLSEHDTGGYFGIDRELAQTVYYENGLDQILADAEASPEVRKVAWEPKISRP